MLPAFSLQTKLEIFDGPAAWHFVRIGRSQSALLWRLFRGAHRGWRSLPVQVTTGRSHWKTSIFYMGEWRQYIMGLRAEIRKREQLKLGDKFRLRLQIRDL